MEVQNKGWRYMLLSLGIIVRQDFFLFLYRFSNALYSFSSLLLTQQSVIMFIARIALFRLKESAKFLMNSNRHSEAIIALTRISRINGEPQVWVLADVLDKLPSNYRSAVNEVESGGERRNFGVGYDANGDSPEGSIRRESFVDNSTRGNLHLSPVIFSNSPLHSPRLNRPPIKSRSSSSSSRISTWIDRLPLSLQPSIEESKLRIEGLLDPEWKKTTVRVWGIWFFAR